MQSFVMQPWTTVRSSSASFTQDESDWLELDAFADAAFWIDVSDVSLPGGTTLYLSLETSPTHDEDLFSPVAGALQLTTTPSLVYARSVRASSTSALSRLLRWRLDLVGSGTWSATFRVSAVPARSRFFSPLDVAGCALWLRSDLGVDVAYGATVSTWSDQSGNGRSAVGAASDQRPTYTASVVNDLPALVFDGSNDRLITPSTSLGIYTALMVATGQAGNGFFWARSTGTGVSDTLYGSTNSTTYIDRGGTVSGWDITGGTNWGQYGATTAKLLTLQFDGTHAGHTLRINGASQSLTSTFANNPGTGATSDQICIGARADGLVAAATSVAEVLFYDSVLDAETLARVEDYLRRRYALY